MKRADKWYQRRLAKYFSEHYSQYEDTAEFWINPSPNQWLFDIPKLKVKIEITCDEKGNVTEFRFPIL